VIRLRRPPVQPSIRWRRKYLPVLMTRTSPPQEVQPGPPHPSPHAQHQELGLQDQQEDHSYDGAYPWHGETLQDLQAVPTNVLEPRPQGDHVDQQPSLTMTSDHSLEGADDQYEDSLQELTDVPAEILDQGPQDDLVDQHPSPTTTSAGNQVDLHEAGLALIEEMKDDAINAVNSSSVEARRKEDILNAIDITKQAADDILNTWLDPVFEPASNLFLKLYEVQRPSPGASFLSLSAEQKSSFNSEMGNVLRLANDFSVKVKDFVKGQGSRVKEKYSPEAEFMFLHYKRGVLPLLTSFLGPYEAAYEEAMIDADSGLEEQPKRDFLKAAKLTMEALEELLDTAAEAWGYKALEGYKFLGDGPEQPWWHCSLEEILPWAQDLARRVDGAIEQYQANDNSASPK